MIAASLLALAVVTAGCSSAKPEAAAPKDSAAAGTTTAASKEPHADQLKIAVPADVGPLNLYLNSGNEGLLELVYDKLFAPSPFVKDPQPWLAESAKQLDDLNWVVKLRQGIAWQDGKPFTADDVKFTFDYYRDGPSNRYTHHVSEVPSIKTITAEDASTVKFTCAYACPTLASITMADLPILPKHIWEKVENPRKFTDLPIGTGPYKLVEYKADQYYRFEANPNYFQGKPLVDSLVMPIIKDPAAMFNALRSGEVDAAGKGLPPELLETFKKLPNMKVVNTSDMTLVELRVNYEKAPFNQPEFRQALSYAVDRKSINDTVMLGQAKPGLQGYPHPDSPWTNPNLSTPFDLAKAKELLDKLGYTDKNGDSVREDANGQPLELNLKAPTTEPTWIRTAELLKDQFAQAGIKVTVEVLDSATISTLLQSRKFDMYMNNIVPHGVADPDQFVMSHRSGYLWTKGLPYPEMDALTDKWMKEPSVEKRKQISFEMQTLFNKQPTSIVMYYPKENYAFRSDKYDNWLESPGFGIVEKLSFLPASARKAAGLAK
ncbi:peptide ABC transporter substrate-binding protein [Paenibacillus thalictri]|uniref:Peptide ABC transporter substrate-binding protein n=2 Tax=Paenibacillus thalictri TaxID=2527873 RepID=A0A4Q9DPS8_9BACL|nr:peptide ABC transporter substrate-binding protein [Paenibacillus thalictri]